MFKAEWIWSIAMKQIWQKKPACFNNSWNKFKFQKGTTRHFKEKGANYVPYLPHPKSTTTCQLFSLKHFGHFSHSSIKTCHKSYSLVYFFRYYDLMDSVYLGHLKKQFSLWQKNDWKNKPSMKYLCLKELGKKIWKHKWQTYCFAPSVSHGDSASSFVIFSSWTLAALILIPPAFTESHATKNIRKKGLCKSLQVNHYMCLITNCNWQTYIKSWTIQSFAFIRKRQLLICPHTSLTHISNDKQWHRQFAECRTTYNLNHNTKHPLYLAITDRWI